MSLNRLSETHKILAWFAWWPSLCDENTLCYAMVLPGRKLAFRAGFWPDCYRGSTEIGPPAGLRPAGGPISMLLRWCGQNPARKGRFSARKHHCAT